MTGRDERESGADAGARAADRVEGGAATDPEGTAGLAQADRADGGTPEGDRSAIPRPPAEPIRSAPTRRVRRWLLLLAIVLPVVVADQGTKFWAVANLTHLFERAGAETAGEKLEAFVGKRKLERIRTRPVVIHPEFFRLRYVENPGAAWGMLSGLHDEVRIPFFYVVSLLAIGIITLIFSRIRREQRLLQVIFALILGGAIGNFIDRIARGYVIDFIDWHWKHQSHFPTFNVADIAISVGLAGLILEGLFGRRRLQGVPHPAPREGEGASPAEAAAHSALSPGAEASEHGGAAGGREPASFPPAASATDAAGAATCTPTSSPGSSRLPS
ncbi:MAG TPA: signal peptidase II [Vulgatibacter sp.]|nr:signal peptidase II [Vulgatibacter sp.]